ncbi:MAG: pteridine-dependent deoxygenase like protein [Wenzhouxiangella sp.]|jgi:chorismate lyase/3-hydroxybenzoate synthase|nr:pteridine-dependent deoxygenase like protein [Wenzhouxiangella sp.]
MSPAQPLPVQDCQHALHLAPQAAAPQSLINFVFDHSRTVWPSSDIGLECLGGDLRCEQWLTGAPVRFGNGDQWHWSRNSDLLAVALSAPDAGDPAEPTARFYRELIGTIRSAGYPHLLRIWNYLPNINGGNGDSERYRRFCVGRGQALAEAGLEDARMCAATAIGTLDQRFRLIAIAGRSPGQSVENPRQVSSWEYPSLYGPRSPAFARATAVNLSDGRVALLISGTASVVGHATAHPGDVLAQTDEAVSNLAALLAEAATDLDRPGLARFGEEAAARVYVRHPEDWPAVYARLREHWPTLPLAGFHGDICRRDLLMEIEAWHCA